jgi:SAM-dependent methyltransferase
MSPVSSGYVTDTTYADTFFRELSPAWLNYVAALHGVAPRPLDRPFSYLELGCGFGTSAVVNAATFPHGSFHACDLNGVHIDSARAYAARLGLDNIRLHAATFTALLGADLPGFDFIALHGVYSWVDAATRDVIRRLIAQVLLPGGLVYVSYNALPGWSHELPLRKLLVEFAATREGTAADRSEAAAMLIDSLSGAGLRYFTANPGAKSAVDAYTRGEGHYLAHEFMNAAWEPCYGVDVADAFAEIGLKPAGSATLADNHLPLVVDAKAAAMISGLPTSRQQQLAVDFATNQRFRRDVFVREDGVRPDTRHLDSTVIGCARDPGEIGVRLRVPRGEMRFQEPFIRDVRALMTRGSCTFEHAVAHLGDGSHDRAGIGRNLLFLVAGGMLAPFACEHHVTGASPSKIATPIVERALIEAAGSSRTRSVIPSAVFGNGVEMDAAEARSLLDWSQRHDSPIPDVERRLAMYTRLGFIA